jgi:hypothetical protein
MKAFDVEKIRFEFGDSWTVAEKWDDTRTFLSGIQRLNGELHDERTGEVSRLGTKAVDIVGVRDGDLYLIEVKDFRGHAIETNRRQRHELPLLIGGKVRDTVAGLVGASRLGSDTALATCAKLLLDDRRRVYVIAWIADPALRPEEPIKQRAAWQKERSDQLKQRVSWLTRYVSVASPFDERLDVTAKNLPGAGQPDPPSIA